MTPPNSTQGDTPSQGIDVASANEEQCPAGGQVYTVYLDENKNGVRDAEEKVLNSQIVCNGVNGQNGSPGVNGSDGVSGYSTLFSLNRVSVGLAACASGSGLQISSGLDIDRNNALDASEISQAQILCDGQTGATGPTGASGADGSNGSNGHSLVFKTLAASADICPAGGTTLLVALDINDTGLYNVLLPNQQSLTLCNGSNGQDAPVAAYTPVEPIMPCGNTVAYKEVLLRLQDGHVLGSFSNDASGAMTRLAFLPDGSFIDTDNSNCSFSLASSGDGKTRSISWLGQVQMSWPILY